MCIKYKYVYRGKFAKKSFLEKHGSFHTKKHGELELLCISRLLKKYYDV